MIREENRFPSRSAAAVREEVKSKRLRIREIAGIEDAVEQCDIIAGRAKARESRASTKTSQGVRAGRPRWRQLRASRCGGGVLHRL